MMFSMQLETQAFHGVAVIVYIGIVNICAAPQKFSVLFCAGLCVYAWPLYNYYHYISFSIHYFINVMILVCVNV